MDGRRGSDQVALAAGALAPIVAAALLVGLRSVIDNTNIALLLVVIVVAAGALGGRAAGACAAVSAALSFNFFHTRPYLSLRVASPDDLETMTLLLVIGLIAGQVAAVARRRGTEARSGKEEVERIWHIAEQAASGADPGHLEPAVECELVALLHLEACWWHARHEPSTVPVLQPSGVFEPWPVRRFSAGDFELPLGGFDIPVSTPGGVVGHYRCVPTAGVGVGLERRRTAFVLAAILGLACGQWPGRDVAAWNSTLPAPAREATP